MRISPCRSAVSSCRSVVATAIYFFLRRVSRHSRGAAIDPSLRWPSSKSTYARCSSSLRASSRAAASSPGAKLTQTLDETTSPALHIAACRCFSSSNAIRFLLLRPCGELVACTPERREEVVVDHLPEHFDGRPLRADDLVADHARDDLVMADAPHRHALVPLDQRLGQLVQLLVLASPDVELDEVEARRRHCLLESLAERRRDAPDLTEAGRVEAAAVPEHAPDRLVLPR